jgi:UDP-3-O-[3-hydroxymyristoyl] glucosamine N-acyltransferase
LDALPGRPRGADLHAALAARYRDSRHVHVQPLGAAARLEATALNRTDMMELFVFANEARGHAVLVARLDNLGKGASGAAVQNLLLMLGLAEEGLARMADIVTGSGPLYSLDGVLPRVHETAFVAPTAAVIGDVEIGAQASVWFHCVLRGDTNLIRIGARSNIQDGSVLHVNPARAWNA